MTDKQALHVLFDTYWSSAGWKKTCETPPEDFAYAKSAGYMFDPVELGHDEIIESLFLSFGLVKLSDVTNAFLASLSTRRLDWRSALGSYAIARNFPRHNFESEERRCLVCGIYGEEKQKEDLNVLNFERHKWGGVRHLDPLYISLDLRLFSQIERVSPSAADRIIFKQLIKAAKSVPADARLADLEKAFGQIVPSNKSERQVLIQILAFCGILQPKERKGFWNSFVKESERELPPVSKIDWEYPACWWRGRDGVNDEALAYYFPT